MWQWQWIAHQLRQTPKKCTTQSARMVAKEIMDHVPEYQRKMGRVDHKELEYRFIKYVDRIKLQNLQQTKKI
jgi:hypothetical protein